MRAVAVDENAVGVKFIVGIAADVGTLINNQDAVTGAGEALGDNAARKTGADD